jgi:hypothetical protein
VWGRLRDAVLEGACAKYLRFKLALFYAPPSSLARLLQLAYDGGYILLAPHLHTLDLGARRKRSLMGTLCECSRRERSIAWV